MTTRSSRLDWRPGGEAACPKCGAVYDVFIAKLPERRDGYAKCESCGALIDEWICDFARRYDRAPSALPTPEPAPAAQPSAEA